MNFDIREQGLFPINGTSAHIGVSPDTLRRAIKRGELKAVRVAGRIMIPRSEIDRIVTMGLGNGRKARTSRRSK